MISVRCMTDTTEEILRKLVMLANGNTQLVTEAFYRAKDNTLDAIVEYIIDRRGNQ
jgi:hypothetical protein